MPDIALANAVLLEAAASYLLPHRASGLSREGLLRWGIRARYDLLFYLPTVNTTSVNNHFYNKQLT